jgi:hypothetical protein
MVAADLTTGKLITFGTGQRSAAQLIGFNWDHYNTYNSYFYGPGFGSTYPPFTFLRYSDDGTTVKFYTSADGNYWVLLSTITKSGSFLGASNYNYIGIGMDAFTSVYGSTLYSWVVQ